MSNSMVSAVLLAAGESKRMGQPKLLLPFGNSTIVEQTVDNLLSSKLDEVIVVVGHQAQQITEKLAIRPVKVVFNPAYHEGMSTSIIRGLNLVEGNRRAFMLCLGDQPLIDSATINRLIEAFLKHDKGIVVPVYRRRRGHPIIFAMRYKAALQELTGDVGGRQIIGEHEDDILEVAVDRPSINIDIDTMNDYQSHINRPS